MGFLEHVNAGEKPSAKKENAKIDAINALSDRLDTLYTGGGRAGGLRVTISNASGSAVPSGGALKVTGCRASGSFDKMKALWLSGSIPLTGAALDEHSELIAYALEGIPAGEIGRAYCPGVMMVAAKLKDSDHQWIDTSDEGLATTDNGLFRILAKSSPASSPSEEGGESGSGESGSGTGDETIFALVYKVEGHRYCNTASKITGPTQTANVSFAGATVPVACPMLANSGVLASGSKVVISYNAYSRKWEIIDFARKHYGHQIKTLGNSGFPTQNNAGTQYVNLTLDDVSHKVYCPMLRSGESIDGNTKVVVSYNQAQGRYEIIEAQCPASASAAALPGSTGDEEEGSGSGSGEGSGSGIGSEPASTGDEESGEGEDEGSGSGSGEGSVEPSGEEEGENAGEEESGTGGGE